MYEQYSLIGVDSNVFSILGYTVEVMRRAKFTPKEREEFLHEMVSGKYDYNMVVAECTEKIYIANERIREKYYANNEEEKDDEW